MMYMKMDKTSCHYNSIGMDETESFVLKAGDNKAVAVKVITLTLRLFCR